MKGKTVLKTSAIVFLLTLVSKFLGLTRELISGYFFGTSNISDAYNIAFFVPNFFMIIVQQVITIAFIPIFIRLFNESESKSNSFASKCMLNISFLTIILSVIIFFTSDYLIGFFASGMDVETSIFASKLLKISCWSLILQSVVLVLFSFLQAKKIFIIPVICGYALDIVSITFFSIAAKTETYTLLGFIPIFVFALQILVLVPSSIKNGFRFKIQKPLFDDSFKEILKISLPALLVVGVNQLNQMVDKNIASNIVVGGISSLNYAQMVTNLFSSLIANSIITILYSEFSDLCAKSSYNELNDRLNNGCSMILLILLPVAIFIAFNSKDIIRIIFQRGAFDDVSTKLTAANLLGYTIGLPFFSLCLLLTRYLYSRNDRYYSILFSVVSLLTNTGLNVIVYFFTNLGTFGIALSTSIANIVNFILLSAFIRKRYSVSFKNEKESFVKYIVASILSCFLSSAFYNGLSIIFKPYLLNFVACGILFLLNYFALIYVLDKQSIRKFNRLKGK